MAAGSMQLVYALARTCFKNGRILIRPTLCWYCTGTRTMCIITLWGTPLKLEALACRVQGYGMVEA